MDPVNDRPRSLRDPAQVAFRRAQLTKPHIAPLAAFAASLRTRGLGEIPDFDPWDGGICASALFLFEKPGPKAFASGFISRNNDDRTAENTFRFMQQAGIPRQATCLWNIVPGWNGVLKLTTAELAQGAATLPELLRLLQHLKVVVLVGKRAAHAWLRFGSLTLPTIESAHPSPVNYACARASWDAIPTQWVQALEFLP